MRNIPLPRPRPRRAFESTRRPGKRQFNVYLPPGLIALVKLAAFERGQTISSFVEEALEARLAPVERSAACTVPGDGQPVPG